MRDVDDRNGTGTDCRGAPGCEPSAPSPTAPCRRPIGPFPRRGHSTSDRSTARRPHVCSCTRGLWPRQPAPRPAQLSSSSTVASRRTRLIGGHGVVGDVQALDGRFSIWILHGENGNSPRSSSVPGSGKRRRSERERVEVQARVGGARRVVFLSSPLMPAEHYF